jgi:hypothetical protein
VGIAAHQLTGAARAWWDTYCDAHENPAAIGWDEFTEEFREYHVPRGAMEAKAEEFRNISQDRERVQEYATRFTRMMRYAPPECVNSEDQKMYYFRKGLSTRIKLALSGNSSRTLREMINKVIEIERDRMEADAHKVRKEQKRRGEGSSRGPPRKRREETPRPPRPCYGHGGTPGSSRGGGTYPATYHRPARDQSAPGPGNWKAATPTPTGGTPVTCFACGQPGHKSFECPQKKKTDTPTGGSAR